MGKSISVTSSIFTDLVNGSVIAISMVDNDERIIILEKMDMNIKDRIKDLIVLMACSRSDVCYGCKRNSRNIIGFLLYKIHGTTLLW